MRSSRSRSLWIALALAAVALMASAGGAAAATTPVKGGELDWGIKSSFREYIKHAASEGKVEVTGGAAEAADGSYRFPVVSGSYDEATEVNEVQYAGSVNYSAYGGVLDITISDPKVVLEDESGAIFAHAISGSTNYGEIELVELDATGVTPVAGAETLTWQGVKSAITAAGEPVFGSYPAGTAFDNVANTDSWVPTAPLVTTAVAGGELDWGVKASFNSYIRNFAEEGKIALSGGAVEAEDGTFRFPAVSGTYDPAAEENEVDYAGSIHYTAYNGLGGGTPLLDITIKDPKVVIVGESGTLYADVVSRSESSGELEEFDDLDLVELDASGITPVAGEDTLSWEAIATAITADGEPVFGNYPAGTAFDPIDLTDSWVPTPPFVEPGGEEGGGSSGGGDTGGTTSTDTTTTEVGTTPTTTTPVAAVKLSALPGVRSVSRGGAAEVAKLICPAGGTACKTSVPKRIAVKIGGKRFVVAVTAPKSVAAGKSATVRLHLSKAARLALGAKKAVAKLTVRVTANGATTSHVVKVKIAGKK
jgi:Htaa